MDKYKKLLTENIESGNSSENLQSSPTIYLVDDTNQDHPANKTRDCSDGKDMGVPCIMLGAFKQAYRSNYIHV